MYPIGTERLYNGYVEVKVSRSKWRWKHHLIWEAAHGPVPEGHLICFADGDNRNFCPDNLIALSRKDFANDRIHKARRARFPVGSETVDTKGYIQIKVAEPKTWRLKHHLIWEAAHGAIPKDHNIYFIDGDKRNFSLDNLAARPKVPPIGAEQVTHGGYIMVKVAEPNTWRWKHHLIWETANGPIPEGNHIHFIDGDNRNFDLENLAAKPRSTPVGTEQIRAGDYTMVKVAEEPQTWRLKHHLIWEAAHGPIPEGNNIHFIDGDKRNFSLDNLAAKPRSVPIGTEQVRADGYVMMKVTEEPQAWRFKHNLIWEAANGAIPEGHALYFADGNPRNCSLENLVLLSLRESGYMVCKDLLKFKAVGEPELFKTAVNLAKLGLAVNEKLKGSTSQGV